LSQLQTDQSTARSAGQNEDLKEISADNPKSKRSEGSKRGFILFAQQKAAFRRLFVS